MFSILAKPIKLLPRLRKQKPWQISICESIMLLGHYFGFEYLIKVLRAAFALSLYNIHSDLSRDIWGNVKCSTYSINPFTELDVKIPHLCKKVLMVSPKTCAKVWQLIRLKGMVFVRGINSYRILWINLVTFFTVLCFHNATNKCIEELKTFQELR